MHFLTLLFTSLVVGFAGAQNSTSSVNLDGVTTTTKNQWCTGQRNNCPYLCGGPANVKPGGNICTGADILNYQCICNNGTAPTMIANYTDTVPNQICQYQFKQCRNQNPGSTACADCGKWSPTDAPKIDAAAASSSSAASASSATASASSSAAPPATSTKAAAPKLGAEHAVGGAAMGLLAAMGMFL